MGVQWKNDLDSALSEAKQNNRAVLIDFSAAPA
jgi:hypothetical protein